MLDLFPPPSFSRSELSPRTWPGITPESTDSLRRIIEDSYEKWHVFFLRGYRAHKYIIIRLSGRTILIRPCSHSVHYALSLWALGADDEIVKASYDLECKHMLPRFGSPAEITDDNFLEHLGDDERVGFFCRPEFYGAYLDYFTTIVKNRGVAAALEKYVFSPEANFIPGRKREAQPEMVSRLMDGVIHSMIHVGFGLEFHVPGLVAEGLAWTAVHFATSVNVIPASLWDTATPPVNLLPHFLSLTLHSTPKHHVRENIHALTILARILKDPRFDVIPEQPEWNAIFTDIDTIHGTVIADYVRAWTFDQNNPRELERKIEELIYANVMIYAVGGWSKQSEFSADFYHLHVVTSAIFLSSIAGILKPASQEILLRSYFSVCLTWWIGRGRPGFNIKGFFAGTSVTLEPILASPSTTRKNILPKADSPQAFSPNPWLHLIQDVLVVPDDHLPKALRALAHFAELYGGRKAGLEDFSATELPDVGLIDGTLFVRAAVLTNSRLRREKDVDVSMSRYWDRKGAYLDYFTEVVKKQGTAEAVEEYLFSQQANFIAGNKDEDQPEMLNRFMDGIMHPMIHVGNGLEFDVPGLVAEGLAWTSVHFKSSSAVMPVSLWKVPVPEPVASLTSRLSQMFFGNSGTSNVSRQTNTHALTILARILKDPRFDAIPAAEHYAVVYSNTTSKHGDAIAEYVRAWTFNQKNPQEVERKIEELIYANAVIYAIAGWSKDEDFNSDFFHVHLVTSSLFLSSICNVLKPASQELLLRSHFAVCLTWWIGRGRPGFDIAGFFAGTSVNPGPIAPFPAPRKDALPKADSPKASNPNPWFSLIQESMVVPDEHFPKTLRALAHFSELYGRRKAGEEDFVAAELPGAELVDGTLFIRAAVLTNSRLRREKDVDVSLGKYWDRKGFYHQS
ncbi:hypothetical protein C0991_009358 [Blastosporella zonata]|nr:hypothetical protein C0991_009358 [Blastosporella zonata]